jgi:hypothetical protein
VSLAAIQLRRSSSGGNKTATSIIVHGAQSKGRYADIREIDLSPVMHKMKRNSLADPVRMAAKLRPARQAIRPA